MVNYNKKGQKKWIQTPQTPYLSYLKLYQASVPQLIHEKYGGKKNQIEQNKAEAHTTESQISWNRSSGLLQCDK